MNSFPNLVKQFNCYLFLGRMLTGSLFKESKKAIVLTSYSRKYPANFRENGKYFVYNWAGYVATSPIALYTLRSFSSACDKRDGNGEVVKHDLTKQMFYIEVENCGVAYIEYDGEGELMILKHTVVDKSLGGRGLGKILAKEALEYVAKNDLQLEIQCSFVREYVRKYAPKYIKYIKK